MITEAEFRRWYAVRDPDAEERLFLERLLAFSRPGFLAIAEWLVETRPVDGMDVLRPLASESAMLERILRETGLSVSAPDGVDAGEWNRRHAPFLSLTRDALGLLESSRAAALDVPGDDWLLDAAPFPAARLDAVRSRWSASLLEVDAAALALRNAGRTSLAGVVENRRDLLASVVRPFFGRRYATLPELASGRMIGAAMRGLHELPSPGRIRDLLGKTVGRVWPAETSGSRGDEILLLTDGRHEVVRKAVAIPADLNGHPEPLEEVLDPHVDFASGRAALLEDIPDHRDALLGFVATGGTTDKTNARYGSPAPASRDAAERLVDKALDLTGYAHRGNWTVGNRTSTRIFFNEVHPAGTEGLVNGRALWHPLLTNHKDAEGRRMFGPGSGNTRMAKLRLVQTSQFLFQVDNYLEDGNTADFRRDVNPALRRRCVARIGKEGSHVDVPLANLVVGTAIAYTFDVPRDAAALAFWNSLRAGDSVRISVLDPNAVAEGRELSSWKLSGRSAWLAALPPGPPPAGLLASIPRRDLLVNASTESTGDWKAAESVSGRWSPLGSGLLEHGLPQTDGNNMWSGGAPDPSRPAPAGTLLDGPARAALIAGSGRVRPADALLDGQAWRDVLIKRETAVYTPRMSAAKDFTFIVGRTGAKPSAPPGRPPDAMADRMHAGDLLVLDGARFSYRRPETFSPAIRLTRSATRYDVAGQSDALELPDRGNMVMYPAGLAVTARGGSASAGPLATAWTAGGPLEDAVFKGWTGRTFESDGNLAAWRWNPQSGVVWQYFRAVVYVSNYGMTVQFFTMQREMPVELFQGDVGSSVQFREARLVGAPGVPAPNYLRFNTPPEAVPSTVSPRRSPNLPVAYPDDVWVRLADPEDYELLIRRAATETRPEHIAALGVSAFGVWDVLDVPPTLPLAHLDVVDVALRRRSAVGAGDSAADAFLPGAADWLDDVPAFTYLDHVEVNASTGRISVRIKPDSGLPDDVERDLALLIRKADGSVHWTENTLDTENPYEWTDMAFASVFSRRREIVDVALCRASALRKAERVWISADRTAVSGPGGPALSVAGVAANSSGDVWLQPPRGTSPAAHRNSVPIWRDSPNLVALVARLDLPGNPAVVSVPSAWTGSGLRWRDPNLARWLVEAGAARAEFALMGAAALLNTASPDWGTPNLRFRPNGDALPASELRHDVFEAIRMAVEEVESDPNPTADDLAFTAWVEANLEQAIGGVPVYANAFLGRDALAALARLGRDVLDATRAANGL